MTSQGTHKCQAPSVLRASHQCSMCGQAPSREKLEGRFHCWSKIGEEVRRNAFWFLQAPGKIPVNTQMQADQKLELHVAVRMYVGRLLLGRNWGIGIFTYFLYSEPRCDCYGNCSYTHLKIAS